MYDIIIVGAGIAGIYCASILQKTYKVLLLESNSHAGGRIHTIESPHYEAGAARFNHRHTRLRSLIKKYRLTPIPISSTFQYLESPQGPEYFLTTMKKLTHVKRTPHLRNISFYDYCKEKLSSQEATLLMNVFGYRSEFVTMNAYDAIHSFQRDFLKEEYFVVQEGFSTLCDRMLVNVDIRLNTPVHTLVREKDGFKVNDERCKQVILTIPPTCLYRFPLLTHIFPLLEGIVACPLLRIYAIYHPVWFKGMPRITTSSILRQIIPINDSGLIMISYVDGDDIQPFIRNNQLKSNKTIQRIIQKELHRLFPDKTIHEPSYFSCHYWKIGAHALLPSYPDPRPKLIQPLPGMYLCGEAYSYQQAWIEGALETAHHVVQHIEL